MENPEGNLIRQYNKRKPSKHRDEGNFRRRLTGGEMKEKNTIAGIRGQ